VAVLAGAYWRLLYGVDLTDEAYYTAAPLRLVLGARPFIDETTPAQLTTGLLLYPVVAAYHAVFGVHAIVLFGRHLHLVFSCIVGMCVYLGVRPFVRTSSEAFIPSLLPIAFVPFSLPDVSYDTLGSGLLVAGAFLGLRFLGTRRFAFLAAAGFAHGLAVFVYPPLVLPASAFAVTVGLMRREEWRRVVAVYGIPALVPLAVLGGVFVNAGIHHVVDVYADARRFHGQGGGVGKAVSVLADVALLALRSPLVITGLAVLVILRRIRPAIAYWAAACLPLLVLLRVDPRAESGPMDYVVVYGLCALPLAFFAGKEAPERAVFLAVWPSAFVGGLATAWTSNNGSINFGAGFAAAPIVTTVLLACFCDRGRQFAVFAAGATTVLFLLVMQFTFIYREDSFTSLRSRISGGPYAGMYTTAERKTFLDTIAADLRRLSPRGCGILFYDEFPAGYLLSSSRPHTNAVFESLVTGASLPAYRRVLLQYYRANGLPDIVVRMTSVPGFAVTMPVSNRDPLDRLVTRSGRYALLAARRDYAIYGRSTARCPATRRSTPLRGTSQ